MFVFSQDIFITKNDNLHKSKAHIRVIPQGTVDKNLGPHRLPGPKALDTTIADNQPFDCTTFVWKS